MYCINLHSMKTILLLEYLGRVFFTCGCHLFYNSLIFNPILLSFGRGSFLCLVHLHSNFQLTPLCSLCDIGLKTVDFKIMRNRLHSFTKVGLSFISPLSLILSTSNHQKALL